MIHTFHKLVRFSLHFNFKCQIDKRMIVFTHNTYVRLKDQIQFIKYIITQTTTVVTIQNSDFFKLDGIYFISTTGIRQDFFIDMLQI